MLRKTILNPRNATLEEMLIHIQRLYPTATIKKPWIGPQMIRVPMGGWVMFFFKQKRNGSILVDFNPPWYWTFITVVIVCALFSFILTILLQQTVITFAGAIPVIIALLVTKAIFRSRNKEVFERFYRDVERAASNPESIGNSTSIF